MNIKRALCSILSLLLWASAAEAQSLTGRLSGRVTNDNRGIAGVTVLINETKAVEITDGDGRYTMRNIPVGTYTLIFTLGDNVVTRQGVQVVAGETTELLIEVEWNIGIYEKLTVYGASKRVEKIVDAPAAVTVVAEEQIAAEAAGGQLPKVLEFTPGAEVTQSGVYDFNVNTRGFNSSVNRRVAVYVDGRNTAAPFLGAQEWSALSFPLDDLQSVEFVRGPSAALYGANASAGVINMTSKSPRDYPGGSLRFTAGQLQNLRRGGQEEAHVDFRWAQSLGKGWYWKVLAGKRGTGDFAVSRNGVCQGGPKAGQSCSADPQCDSDPDADDGVCLPMPGPEYSQPCETTDLGIPIAGGPDRPDGTKEGCLPLEQIPLIFTRNEITTGNIRFDKYFSDDEILSFEAGYAKIQGPIFQTGIGRITTLDSERPWGRISYSRPHWNALAYYSGRDASQKSLQSQALLPTDTTRWSVELQTNWEFAGGKGRAVGGLAYIEDDIDTADPATGEQTLITMPISANYRAVFGQVDYRPLDKLKLVFAGRVDASTLHRTFFSPKAAVVWNATDNHTFRFTYNRAFQVANYSEFFLFAEVLNAGTKFLADICRNVFVPLPGEDPPFKIGIDCNLGDETPVLAVGNQDLDLETTEMYELGYAAVLGKKAFLTVDYYRGTSKDFITDLRPQCGASLDPEERDDDVRFPPGGLCEGDPSLGLPPAEFLTNPNYSAWVSTPEAETTLVDPFTPGATQTVADSVRFALANSGQGNIAGILLSNALTCDPANYDNEECETIIAAVSYTNFGEVDTQGIDLGFNYYFTNALNLQFTFSWFDYKVQNLPPGGDPTGLLPNTPEYKTGLGIYYQTRRWNASLTGRWVDKFPWSVGLFDGPVLSYVTSDANVSYKISDTWGVGLNASNITDNQEYQAFGGDRLGRRALGYFQYAW